MASMVKPYILNEAFQSLPPLLQSLPEQMLNCQISLAAAKHVKHVGFRGATIDWN